MKRADGIICVGGVGTGRIFQHAHMRVYPRLIGQARLVGLYDVNAARAQQAREKYVAMLGEFAAAHPEAAEAVQSNLSELRCYDSLGALLEDVDVIDVATHARGRMEIAISALERGVHVMVEKPMARTWSEADRAARAAASHPDVFFQLNDDNAFDPKYRVLHDLIAQGEIGKVHYMSLIRGSGLDATSVLKSQASALDNGGGCLMDYGSHGLAGAWYALGTHFRPVTVEAVRIAVLFPHRVLEGEPCVMEVDDNAQIKVRFEDPQTGSWVTVFLEATWSGGHIGLEKEKPGGQAGGYLHTIGDEGIIHSNSAARITIQRWDGGETVLPLREYPGESVSFDDQIGGFLRGVREGVPPEINVDFGAVIIAACGAAYLSAIRGCAVTLDEFKRFSRGYVEKYGDCEQADDAIVLALLEPYRREIR
jgi:predicted dehydrogenase